MKTKQIIIILILILLNFKENSAKILETLDAHKITLKNGMSLILKEDHSNPLVSINLYVKTGSINENKEAGCR
ncbi:MAG: hypothetical protein HYU63_03210 [Armatimonadetes bacterium]|nr:hypothetical protein [Armatimonadota bacterium]